MRTKAKKYIHTESVNALKGLKLEFNILSFHKKKFPHKGNATLKLKKINNKIIATAQTLNLHSHLFEEEKIHSNDKQKPKFYLHDLFIP